MMETNKYDQRHFLAQYADKVTPKFNPALFERDTNKIIKALQDVILSYQKTNGYYKIIVEQFTIVEDYARIQEILGAHEDKMKSNEKKKRINQYRHINLRDSDTVLMVVHYYIETTKGYERINVYILVPRIVNRFYFRISGNYYAAQYQISESSTYNNSYSANSKKHCVTLKTVNSVIVQMYKNEYQVEDVHGRIVEMKNFSLYVFGKATPAFRYVLAKYGLSQVMKLCHYEDIMLTHDPSNLDLETYYIFEAKEGIFIGVPIMIYENDLTVQSFVYTLMNTMYKETKFEDIFDPSYWIDSIGKNYNSDNTFQKGISLCNSLESIYDIPTRNAIVLPPELKENIYQIILWMMREHHNLMDKDNLDMNYKRIKYEEYIASLYATKLVKNAYRLQDTPRITIDKIRKTIVIRPTILLENITKCNLINYRNSVNDLDAITATKFSFKSPRIGKGGNSKTSIYKDIHPSQLGIIDIDSSSKSDPGASGVLTPMLDLYGEDNNRFSEAEEPNTWEDNFKELVQNYRNLVGIQETVEFQQQVLGVQGLDSKLDDVRNTLMQVKDLVSPISKINPYNDDNSVVDLEDGGMITYE